MKQKLKLLPYLYQMADVMAIGFTLAEKRDDSALGPFSRSLGISAPAGRDVHEVYLRVKSYPSVLGKISNLMGERKVDILSVSGQVADDKKTARLIFYVEMGSAASSIEELEGALRKQEFVLDVITRPRNRMYFEDIMFPLTSGGHYRVFTVGARSWVSLVKQLLEKFGSGGKAILQEEGVAVGEEMVDRIGNRFEKADKEILLDNLIGLFRGSGLGLLEIKSGGSSGERSSFRIAIREPAAAESDAPILDDFLVGVVKGAISKILSKDLRVKDAAYEDGKITFELVEA